MQTVVDPTSIAPPAANYAHGILVTSPARWLHTAGVVPVAPDGSVPDGVAAQAEVIWANIGAILAEAGMGFADLVGITTYVVAGEAVAPAITIRDRMLDGRRIASTLVTVAALAQPAWRIEIAAIAAQ